MLLENENLDAESHATFIANIDPTLWRSRGIILASCLNNQVLDKTRLFHLQLT